jgi:hypothetical protein
MPLTTGTIAISESFLKEKDACDPKLVLDIVSSCNLFGQDGAVWKRFRFPNILPERYHGAIWTNKIALSEEELACLLFDVMMQYMTRKKLVYVYTSAGGLFGADPNDNGKINCKDCATSFATLLYAFGFDACNLVYNHSNPEDRSTIKIMAKTAAEVGQGTVQGYSGAVVEVDVDAASMPGIPLADSISNAFKPKYQGASPAVEMCDRDPFLNHFVLYVSGLGFSFPYFDPLLGRRYKNGQEDLFTAYYRNAGGDLQYRYGGNETVQMFARLDQPNARLYSVPAKMSFREPSFQKAKARYIDQGLFLVIDQADWQLQPTKAPMDGRPRANVDAPLPAMMSGRGRSNQITTFSHPRIILDVCGLG